jgi:biopolymer transport protein TolR
MALKLSPRQRSYIRKRANAGQLDPSELVGELNIIPFLDIVVNLIMFLLATSEYVLLISQIESDLPKIARGRGKQDSVETPLNLNVTVTDVGVIVTGSGGKLSPGCTGIDPAGSRSITVPLRGKTYDWAGLTECASKVKVQFEDEDTVTVSADPQIQYEHVVAAMDAMRGKGKVELFPKVLVSVGVR